MLNDQTEWASDKERAVILREFLFPNLTGGQAVTPKAVSKRLRQHVGEPVRYSDQLDGKPRTRTLRLITGEDAHTKTITFSVPARNE